MLSQKHTIQLTPPATPPPIPEPDQLRMGPLHLLSNVERDHLGPNVRRTRIGLSSASEDY